MAHDHNPTIVSPNALALLPADGFTIIDVRKPKARAASGLGIPGALWRHPFDAANWASEFRNGKVVLFCVHGHEVSQAVRGYLSEMEIDAVIIEGGFEAWRQAGLPVEPLVEANA